MLLADLPYARETAAGASKAAFFSVRDSRRLSELMRAVAAGDYSQLSAVAPKEADGPRAETWTDLFDQLLS